MTTWRERWRQSRFEWRVFRLLRLASWCGITGSTATTAMPIRYGRRWDRHRARKLEAAGHLQSQGSSQWVAVKGGAVELGFKLTRQAVPLVQVSW